MFFRSLFLFSLFLVVFATHDHDEGISPRGGLPQAFKVLVGFEGVMMVLLLLFFLSSSSFTFFAFRARDRTS